MSEFSASDAALEGFNVIRRHWRVVAGWAAFNLLALVAMVVITVVIVLMLVASTGSGQGQAPGDLSAVVGGVVAVLGAALTEVVIAAGLFRLMLRPDEPAFLFLRLGRDEIRLLAVWALGIAALGLLVALSVALGEAADRLFPAARILPGLAVAVVAIWLGLRFCLAVPISFAERRIDFARSWRLTRGHAWGLLGMSLLAACLLALVSIVWWLAVFMLTGALTGFHDFASLAGADALETHPGRYLLQLAAQMLFAPVLWVLSQAPLAAAYQALSAPADT
ncbi:hypothetical protein DJ021_15090 [Phenylobacterium hankyongense]|uniref:Glycerophosphoryl diester phosphodiesterase membrane domain-containing protein n=1 Tax=Phenylobacterium hankyongense TaxID=1813876 RepID=A0A328B0Y1_9CAUL|nr:hypothetical protein [Phenylobacterium hankyongense]RAK61040.1 hypothetical protein DJ021_15090 [Phenylobacterium hankyongense]